MPTYIDDSDAERPDEPALYEVTVDVGKRGYENWPDHLTSLDFIPEANSDVARLLVPKEQLAELTGAGLKFEVVAQRGAQPLDPRLVLDDAVAAKRTRQRLQAILDLGPR